MRRRTLIGAFLFGLLAAPTYATQFGLFYLTWHCPFSDHNPYPWTGNPPYNMTQAKQGLAPWGPLSAWHWKDEPQDGYYCLATDDAVLRRHAQLIRDAGIDFVYIDSTNHDSTDPRLAVTPNEMIIAPFERMLAVWSTVPNAPKIVPWAPATDLTQNPSPMIDYMASRLAAYPNLQFIYQGKPLLLVTENHIFASSQAHIDRLALTNTVRKMWAFNGSGPMWSFLEMCANSPTFKQTSGNFPCQVNPYLQNGVPEQIPVSFAYQVPWMSDSMSAVPKFDGRTFVRQFDNVFQHRNIPIVLIAEWNEWLAIRFCQDAQGIATTNPALCVAPAGSSANDQFPDGNKMFVDEYVEPYSRDIEPSKTSGDFYYRLMKQCIASYRAGASSCGDVTASAIFPPPGSLGASLTPTFSWTIAWERNQYIVDLSEDPNFSWWWAGNSSTLSIPLSGISNTSFSGGRPPPAQLTLGKTYYWRILAYSATMPGITSPVYQFSTASPPVNQPPTVGAGVDQTITLPASANLAGTVSDDGLPNPPGALTATWSKVSGPGTVTFGNAASRTTTASFSMAGSYVLRLTASDGTLSSADDLTVTVHPPLRSPVGVFDTFMGAVASGWAFDPDHTSSTIIVDVYMDGNWVSSVNTTDLRTDVNNAYGISGTHGFHYAIPAPYLNGQQHTIGIYGIDIDDTSGASNVELQGSPITFSSPRVATTAGANPSPVTGTTTNLSVLGSDDAGEATLTYSWATTGTPPAAVSFSVNGTNAAKNTVATFTRAGSYSFQVTIRDAQGLTATSNVNVTVNPAPPVNQPPTASAGSDLSVSLSGSANLLGVAGDDGFPNPPGALTTLWSKVSGPGTVSFGNAANRSTTVSFSAVGTYLLRLTANDSVLSASDDVQVIVNSNPPSNQAPTVNAGIDQMIPWPSAANLNGIATDDGLPSPPAAVSTLWSKVSGPGSVTLLNASNRTTSAAFAAPGTYVLRLAASDSALSAFDEITITVNSSAGVNLPTPSLSNWPSYASLRDTLTIQYPPGYPVDHFEWSFDFQGAAAPALRGAAKVIVASIRTASPQLNLGTQGLQPGRYLISLTAVDTSGQSSAPGQASLILTAANALSSVRVRPNPFRSSRGDSAVIFDQLPAMSTVKIFTVSGRWVATLAATAGSANWDLKNSSGESVASGVYLYVATDGQGETARGKFSVIR